MTTPLNIGARLECAVEKLAVGGRGLCRVEGVVLFLERALPGQRVIAQITAAKKGYAEGRVVKILEESPHKRQAECPRFGACGGCLWQDLDYGEQLRWKREFVRESLERLAGLRGVEVDDVLTAGETMRYRNKMEFAFAGRGQGLRLGLHALGAPGRVLDLETCGLLPEAGEAILRRARELCRESGVGAWTDGGRDGGADGKEGGRGRRESRGGERDFRRGAASSAGQASSTDPVGATGRERGTDGRAGARGEDGRETSAGQADHGYWRWLVLRQSRATGEFLAQFITAPNGPHEVVRYVGERLRREFPLLTSVVHGLRGSRSLVAQAERTLWKGGPGFIEEQLGDVRYRISAGSFFQTNTAGAKLLYDQVLELAGLTGRERVLDLYCGNGGIALYAARRAASVEGVEINPTALADARANAALNGIGNCAFTLGDIRETLLARRADAERPDVVIVDPPRAGLHPDIVQALLEAAPPRIVYVSCNPSTQARDVKALAERYEATAVRPVDMFPQTPHVECVARLDIRKG